MVPEKLKLISLIIILLIGTLTMTTVQADNDELYYDELLVQVMPQYVEPEGWMEGQPLVLTGKHGVLKNPAEEAVQPEIAVYVPSDSPDFLLSLVGDFDDEQTVYELDYEFDEATGLVTWTPEEVIQPGGTYQFVVEYYMDPFEVEGDHHSFTYEYQLDYDAREMSLLFFEPYGASGFTVDQEPDRMTEMFNIPVHGFDIENVDANWSGSYGVSYEKSDPVTTLDALETMEPPDDDIHAGFRNDLPQDHPDVGGMEGGGQPLIDTTSAVIISAAIVIAAFLVFLGLRSRPRASSRTSNHIGSAVNIEEEKQRLRKQYMNGTLDDEGYRKEMRKLNQ